MSTDVSRPASEEGRDVEAERLATYDPALRYYAGFDRWAKRPMLRREICVARSNAVFHILDDRGQIWFWDDDWNIWLGIGDPAEAHLHAENRAFVAAMRRAVPVIHLLTETKSIGERAAAQDALCSLPVRWVRHSKLLRPAATYVAGSARHTSIAASPRRTPGKSPTFPRLTGWKISRASCVNYRRPSSETSRSGTRPTSDTALLWAAAGLDPVGSPTRPRLAQYPGMHAPLRACVHA